MAWFLHIEFNKKLHIGLGFIFRKAMSFGAFDSESFVQLDTKLNFLQWFL